MGVPCKNGDHHNYANEIYNKADTKKKNVDTSMGARFAVQNQFYYNFLKNLKTDNFVPQFFPGKQHLQKKTKCTMYAATKIQDICNIRFWIFKLYFRDFSI